MLHNDPEVELRSLWRGVHMPVVGNQASDVYIRDTITVGKTKGIVPNVITHALQTSAGHAVFTRINKSPAKAPPSCDGPP